MTDAVGVIQQFFWQAFNIPPESFWGAIGGAIVAGAIVFFFMKVILDRIAGENDEVKRIGNGVSLVIAIGAIVYILSAGVWEVLIGFVNLMILFGVFIFLLILHTIYRTQRAKHIEAGKSKWKAKQDFYRETKGFFGARKAWKEEKMASKLTRKIRHSSGAGKLEEEERLLEELGAAVRGLENELKELNNAISKIGDKNTLEKNQISELFQITYKIRKELEKLQKIYKYNKDLKKISKHDYKRVLDLLKDALKQVKGIEDQIRGGTKPSLDELNRIHAELDAIFKSLLNEYRKVAWELKTLEDWIKWMFGVIKQIHEIYSGEISKENVVEARKSIMSASRTFSVSVGKFISAYESITGNKGAPVVTKALELKERMDDIVSYWNKYPRGTSESSIETLKGKMNAVSKAAEELKKELEKELQSK